MMQMTLTLLILSLIPMAIIMLSSMLMSTPTKETPNREKASPYECGFDPLSKARMPFSLRFFRLGILFIVFDVEIALTIPFQIMTQTNMPHLFMFPTTIFFFLLLLGLLHEWNEGVLKWSE